MYSGYAKHHIPKLFFPDRFISHAARLANLSPSLLFFIIIFDELPFLVCYLSKVRFLSKTNTSAI